MNLGIYRPGQGYWVRVMTAVAAGVLVLATAGWLFKEMVRIPVPVKHWNILVQVPTGEVDAGDTVELYVDEDTTTAFASGTLESSITAGSGIQLQVRDIIPLDKEQDQDPTGAAYIRTAGGFEGVTQSTNISRIQLFEQVYLQAGVAGVTMLIGSFIVYFFVAAKPGSVDFLCSTDGEMKKVNWSTKRDIYRSTLVVIFSSLIIASGLFAVDTVFAAFFQFVGVLDK